MSRKAGKIREFYSFNIIKLSLAFLFLGLTFLALSPAFERIRIVPCKVFDVPEGKLSFCALNPVVESNSLYFGTCVLDYAYQVMYLAMMAVMIPYTLGCFAFMLYYGYIKNLMKKAE